MPMWGVAMELRMTRRRVWGLMPLGDDDDGQARVEGELWARLNR